MSKTSDIRKSHESEEKMYYNVNADYNTTDKSTGKWRKSSPIRKNSRRHSSIDGRMRTLPGAHEEAIVNLKEAIAEEQSAIAEVENKSERERAQRRYTRGEDIDAGKYDFRTFNNSQRILLGLKIASMKSRPVNMHQFESRKKIDLSSIINPIVKPVVADVNYNEHSPENNPVNFPTAPEKVEKRPISSSGLLPVDDIENLTRGLLANLRHEISKKENKRKVDQFLAMNM